MSSPVATTSPTGSFRSDYFFDNDGTDIVIDQTDAADSATTTSTAPSSTAASPSSNSASPAGSPAQHPTAPRRATLDGLAGLELNKEQRVGPFALGPVLGRGCTGTVRLGTHKETGFQVAFKIIKKKHLNSKPRLWAKVKREIAILKLIEHPNILKLYDVLETEDRLYLVLENVKGGELFDYIIAKGRLDRDLSLQMIAQIVQGLEHCHAHSICHRDLKPENLLLDEKLNIKIADFGMAQLMKRNSLLKTSCGSPHYASPEIINGGAYDGKRSDVWSIGVILFALTTGSLPFDDDSLPALLNKVAKGEYRTPSHLAEDIADLISRMLTVDPLKRIPMSSIKNHPCYRGTQHFDPPLASPSATLRSIQQELRNGIDENILSDLESLGWGVKDELRTSLLNGTASDQEKVFYKLLVDRKRARINELSRLSPKRPTRSLSLGAGIPPSFANGPSTSGIFDFTNEPLPALPLPTIPSGQNMRPRQPMPTYNPAPYQEIPTGHPLSTPQQQLQSNNNNYHQHQSQSAQQQQSSSYLLPQVPPPIQLPQHQYVAPALPLSPLIMPSPHHHSHAVSSSASPMPSPLPSPLPSPAHANLSPLITNLQSPAHFCMNSPPQTPTPNNYSAGAYGYGQMTQQQPTIPARLYPLPVSSGTTPMSSTSSMGSPTPMSPEQSYPPALLFTTSPPVKARRVPADIPPIAATAASVPAPRRRLVFRPSAVTTPATGALPLPGSAGSTPSTSQAEASSSQSQSNTGHGSGGAESPSPPTPPRHPRVTSYSGETTAGSLRSSSNSGAAITTTNVGATSSTANKMVVVRPRSSSASSNPLSTTSNAPSTSTSSGTNNGSRLMMPPAPLSSTSAPVSPMHAAMSSSSSPGMLPMYLPTGGTSPMFPPPMQPASPLSISIGSTSSPPSSPPHTPDMMTPVGLSFPSVSSSSSSSSRPSSRNGSGGNRTDVMGGGHHHSHSSSAGIEPGSTGITRPPSSHATHSDTRGSIEQKASMSLLPESARVASSSIGGGRTSGTMGTTRMPSMTNTLLDSPEPKVVMTPRFHRRRLVTAEHDNDDAITPTTHSSPKTSWFSSIFARRPSLDVVGKISKGASGGGVYSSKGLVQITTEVTHVLGSMDVPFKLKKNSLFEVEYSSMPTVKSPVARKAMIATASSAPTPVTTSTASAFFRRNTAPAPPGHKAIPQSEKGGKGSSAPADMDGSDLMTAEDALAQLTEPRQPSPPLPNSIDEGKMSTAVAPLLNNIGFPAMSPSMTTHHSAGSAIPSHSPATVTYLSSPATRVRGISESSAANTTSGSGPPVAGQSLVKFTIEIVQEKSKDLRCVKFQHKSGDLLTFQRVQKDIQQRLKL